MDCVKVSHLFFTSIALVTFSMMSTTATEFTCIYILVALVLHVAVLPVQLTNELLADQHVVVGPTVMAIVVVQLHGYDGTTVDHLILVDGGGTVTSTSIF